MDEREMAVIALDDEARALLDAVVEQWGDCPLPPGVRQWLLTLVERHEGLVLEIAPRFRNAFTAASLHEMVQAGEVGNHFSPGKMAGIAGECARVRGEFIVRLHDLACVILALAGCALGGADAEAVSCSDCDTIHISLDEMAAEDPATPLLNQLGLDLTRAARESTLSPVIGREEEIQLVIETLCRRTKRNPALIGPAGVGKTAIVEGLAQRIVAGEVPLILHGVRIVMVSVTSLVAGCTLVGQFEERMTELLKEAGMPGIVLFIDEAHTMLGAGSAGKASNDLANMLKQAMARGDIACIAATTDEEYRQYIESDPALERRFQLIRVQELTAAQTLTVLQGLRARLAVDRGVAVSDTLLAWMVGFANEHMRNRHFPDKGVDVLEQCVAYALTQGRTVLTQADAEVVSRRMVGMPCAVNERLAALSAALRKRSLLPLATIDAIIHRLGITMRGLDFRAQRPNAVVLLLKGAAVQSDLLCETIAECLFGSSERVVTLDMGRIANSTDMSMLLGSPPGYIGYGGRVPLHKVMQMPWCVLRIEGLHTCHATAREVLTQGLRRGCLLLADGKRAFLSDAVVVMNAAYDPCSDAPMGFGPHDGDSSVALHHRAGDYLGTDLLNEVDVLCHELCENPDATLRWLRESLLADLDARFLPQGVNLCYDDTLLAWLAGQRNGCCDTADWERLIENILCPLIIPHLPDALTGGSIRLRLTVVAGQCVVEHQA